MRSAYIAGLCLSTCLTTPAAAEQWYRIATTDNSVDYADADTIRRFGEIVSVDVFRGFAGLEGEDSGYLKIALDVSCADKRFRVTRGVAYDTRRQYVTTDEAVTSWEAIAANSIAEQVRRFTCDGALRDTPVANPFDDADEYWYYYYAG